MVVRLTAIFKFALLLTLIFHFPLSIFHCKRLQAFAYPLSQRGCRPQAAGVSSMASRLVYISLRTLLLRGFPLQRQFPAGGVEEAGLYVGPVHQVPPAAHVARSVILVFEIIGVFPHVTNQDGDGALQD